MPDLRTPNWYPINQLPLYTHLVGEMLEDLEIQYQNFKEAENRPGALNDAIISRARQLYTSQREDFWVVEEQIKKWRGQTANLETHQDLDQLEQQLTRTKELNGLVLGLLQRLRNQTIEGLLSKNDMELGLEVLSGKFKR